MFQPRFSKLLCSLHGNQVQLTAEMRALGGSEEEWLKEGLPKSDGAPAMPVAPFTTHSTQLLMVGQWEWQQETSKRLQCSWGLRVVGHLLLSR